MAAKKGFSFKQLQIDKATTTMVIFIAAATAVFIFSMVASRALLSQRSYLANVISQKETARDQLASNLAAKNTLVAAYQQFVDQPENIIGGSSSGDGENDGDNARIILDALPSVYDFPALTTSLEKLLTTATNVRIEEIGGVDDEIAQSGVITDTPAPIEMPFQVGVSGSYQGIQDLITVFDRSIRPFHIRTLSLTGADAEMRLQMTAKTYYQPGKTVNIKYLEVQ